MAACCCVHRFRKAWRPAPASVSLRRGAIAMRCAPPSRCYPEPTAPLQQEMLAEYLGSGGYERHLRVFRERLQDAGRTHVAVRAGRLSGRHEAVTPARRVRALGRAAGESRTRSALYDEAIRLGVDFVPGVMFSASGRYGNCLRLNAGFPVTARTAGRDPSPGWAVSRGRQNALLTTPPSTRSAAPVVAEAGTPRGCRR